MKNQYSQRKVTASTVLLLICIVVIAIVVSYSAANITKSAARIMGGEYFREIYILDQVNNWYGISK